MQLRNDNRRQKRKLHVYKAKDGWRWKLEAPNGHIVADSGEAYFRAWDASDMGTSVTGLKPHFEDPSLLVFPGDRRHG